MRSTHAFTHPSAVHPAYDLFIPAVPVIYTTLFSKRVPRPGGHRAGLGEEGSPAARAGFISAAWGPGEPSPHVGDLSRCLGFLGWEGQPASCYLRVSKLILTEDRVWKTEVGLKHKSHGKLGGEQRRILALGNQ